MNMNFDPATGCRGGGRRARKMARMAHLAAVLHECAGRGMGGSPFGFGGPFGSGRGEGGRGGGRGPGGGRPGGRGRRGMFARDELRLLLLHLIAETPSHGYDLIKAVEGLSGGEYAPSPGVIYPTLQMMQDEGLITEMPDETSRKVFAASEAGLTELAEQSEVVQQLLQRLAGLAEQQQTSPHRQIHRAMENLRNSLRFHRKAGDLDEALIEQIVDLIDETARKIERL